MREDNFPSVTGVNLLRQTVHFPKDLPARFNLLLIPFFQYQQQSVNTWIPTAQRLEASEIEFTYFELPTIRKMNPLNQFFINEGMRAGIPNQHSREHTITLYLDKAAFRQALRIDNEDEITILLVSRSGQILWRTTGNYTKEKEQALQQILEQTTIV